MVGRYSPGNASVQYEINMHVLPDNGEASHYRNDKEITVRSDQIIRNNT